MRCGGLVGCGLGCGLSCKRGCGLGCSCLGSRLGRAAVQSMPGWSGSGVVARDEAGDGRLDAEAVAAAGASGAEGRGALGAAGGAEVWDVRISKHERTRVAWRQARKAALRVETAWKDVWERRARAAEEA